MSASEYLAGLSFLLATLGSIIGGTTSILRRRLNHLTGAEWWTAFALVATAALAFAHVVPGALMVLNRGTVLACAVAFAAAARSVPRSTDAREPSDAVETSGVPQMTIALVAVAVLAVWLVATTWHDMPIASHDTDTLDFHLPAVAQWIQAKSIWPIAEFRPFTAYGHYPGNGDILILSVMLPWRSEAFVRLVNPVFLVIGFIAIYAAARRLRASRSAALVAAAVFASIPIVLLSTISGGLTDVIFVATFASGILFLLRHRSSGRWSDLVLAGIGLGFAFGTKWYGVTSVALVLVVWLAANIFERRPFRGIAGRSAAIGLVVLLSGGFWLLRNYAASRNPLYPQKVGAFGTTIFDGPHDILRECAGFTFVHYLTTLDPWRQHILPAFARSYALPGALLGVLVLLSSIKALRGGVMRSASRTDDRARLVACACVVLLAAIYAVTPYSAWGIDGEPSLVAANTRYLLPSLVIAAVVGAFALGRSGWMSTAGHAIGLAAVLEGSRQVFPVGGRTVVGATLALAIVLGICLTVRHRSHGVQMGLAVCGGLILVIAASIAGYTSQRAFYADRYRGIDPTIDWIVRHAEAGQRIGLAGAWNSTSPVFPSYGSHVGNRVSYIGDDVDGWLHPYETRSGFAAALRRNPRDLVLVGKVEFPQECKVPGPGTEELLDWAKDAGLERLVESPRFALFRAPPR